MSLSQIIVLRAIAALLLAILFVGGAAAVALIAASLGPNPGDRMALMTLPLLAALMILPAAALLAIAIAFRKSLPAWEAGLYRAVSLIWLIPSIPLVLFG